MRIFPRTKSHIRQGHSVNIYVSKVGVYPKKNQEKLQSYQYFEMLFGLKMKFNFLKDFAPM